MNTTRSEGGKEGGTHILVAVLVLGSLWGLSEVLLNDVIRSAGLPWRAGILFGVGMLLMGIALGFLRKPIALPGIALVAILMKQMVVPILGVSILCKANSCIAVMLQATVLGGLAGLAGRRLSASRRIHAGAGGITGLLSAVPFYFIGLRAAPCPYLLSFGRPGGFAAFLVSEGLVWAAFGAILFPLGHGLGERLGSPRGAKWTRRPLLYYGTSAVLALFCWILAGLTMVSG